MSKKIKLSSVAAFRKIHCTAATLAEFLGVSIAFVRNQTANGYWPRSPHRGLLNLNDCLQAHIAKLKGTEKAGGLRAQTTRLTKIRADLAELQRQQQAADMIDVDRALHLFSSIAGAAKERANRLPSRLAGPIANETDPSKIQVLLEHAIAEAFTLHEPHLMTGANGSDFRQ